MVVLSILAVVFMLAYAYSLRASSHLITTARMITATRANYLAEAGARLALAHLDDWSAPYLRKATFSTGEVVIATTRKDEVVTIVSTCQLGEVIKEISVQHSQSEGVMRWSETTR